MDYDKRKTKEQASREKLAEVVKAGEALGFWRAILPTTPSEEGAAWRWADVETPAGHRFSLRGGSWGREGAISASLTSIKGEHRQEVGPHDVRTGAKAPEASASYERPAEVIAKDLNRRVMAHPDSIAIGEAMKETLARRVSDWEKLRRHTTKLAGLGYDIRVGDTETYQANAYRAGFPPVKVYSSGRVSFEASCDVATFAEVLKLIGTQD